MKALETKMDVPEFDAFADEYHEQHRRNISLTGEAPEYFAKYKIEVLKQVCDASGKYVSSIIDFGSGIGNSIPYFDCVFPKALLTCADVSRRCLSISEKRFPGLAETRLIEGINIPARAHSFDVAFSACVFHHISHDEHMHWLKELHRVTKPKGLLVIFEHNPLNPLTRRAVNSCPFDANAKLVRASQLALNINKAGWLQPKLRYHIFFPRALSVLRRFDRYLSFLPLGAQYSIAAKKSA